MEGKGGTEVGDASPLRTEHEPEMDRDSAGKATTRSMKEKNGGSQKEEESECLNGEGLIGRRPNSRWLECDSGEV